MTHRNFQSVTAIFLSMTVGACTQAPSYFDVPYSPSGTPLVKSIVQRIKCELADLVEDESDHQFIRAETLIRLDYNVAMLLSIDANGTAGIAPSLTFPGTMLSVNITPSMKLSRQDTINLNISFSMREVYLGWKNDHEYYKCPDPDTNLAGNLGIRAKVASALDIGELIYSTTAKPNDGIFSGVINFTATKSIDKAGPTWTLTNFSDPGPFITASNVNTDKILFGFAAGPNAFKPFDRKSIKPGPFSANAERALGVAITNDLSTQLSGIRNSLR